MHEPVNLPDNAPGLERMLFLEVEEGTRKVVGCGTAQNGANDHGANDHGGDGQGGDSPSAGSILGEALPELNGTYWLNGPAGFKVGTQSYGHWLDGDGLVGSISFSPSSGVKVSQRFVQTAKRRAEAQAGKAMFRTFGTSFPGDLLERRIGLASPCNVSIYRLGSHLLAAGEQGLPWEIDPETLATLEPFNAKGRLHPVSPFSAHSRLDPHNGETITFGISYSSQRPMLNLYRFDAHANLEMRARIDLPFPCSIHDLALTENYVVFHISPYVLDMSSLQAGSSVLQSLTWQPERGSFVLLARRSDGAEVARIPVGRGYCLHLINSFESTVHGAGRTIVLDAVEYEEPLYPSYSVPDLFVAPPLGRPVRWIFDLEAGVLAAKKLLVDDSSADLALDFPALLPGTETLACDRSWMLGVSTARLPGRSFFDLLVTVDWGNQSLGKIAAPEGWFFGSEPAVATTVDGEPVLLVLGFDPLEVRSELWFYGIDGSAASLLTRLRLPTAIPPRFHSQFVPA